MSSALGSPRPGFFSSSRYAVVGASTDPAKYGNKVLRWYKARDLPVVPVNPKEPQVEEIEAIKSIHDLSADELKQTSISVITPPKVSLQLLKDAFAAGVPFVWLQPGAEDASVKEYIDKELNDDQKTRIAFGGPCILVQGDSLLKEAKSGKL